MPQSRGLGLPVHTSVSSRKRPGNSNQLTTPQGGEFSTYMFVCFCLNAYVQNCKGKDLFVKRAKNCMYLFVTTSVLYCIRCNEMYTVDALRLIILTVVLTLCLNE